MILKLRTIRKFRNLRTQNNFEYIEEMTYEYCTMHFIKPSYNFIIKMNTEEGEKEENIFETQVLK